MQTAMCKLQYDANCNILLEYANCNISLRFNSTFSFRFNFTFGFRFKFKFKFKQTAICRLQCANCNMQTVIYYCNMQTGIYKPKYTNCNIQTGICKLPDSVPHSKIGILRLDSTQIWYWVPDSVSGSIPHWVSDSNLNSSKLQYAICIL